MASPSSVSPLAVTLELLFQLKDLYIKIKKCWGFHSTCVDEVRTLTKNYADVSRNLPQYTRRCLSVRSSIPSLCFRLHLLVINPQL